MKAALTDFSSWPSLALFLLLNDLIVKRMSTKSLQGQCDRTVRQQTHKFQHKHE